MSKGVNGEAVGKFSAASVASDFFEEAGTSKGLSVAIEE